MAGIYDACTVTFLHCCLIFHVLDEKINSLRRVSVLTQDLIRELIPEVGLRADFENCLNDFKTSASKEVNYG